MSVIINGKGTVGIRGGAVIGAPIITQFITTWKTDNAGTSTSTQIRIPTVGSGYACTVDWGDGTSNSYSGTAPTMLHTYSVAGTYTVKISGTFPRIYFNNAGDKAKLLTIENWGNIVWGSMSFAFYGCNNLKLNALDIPNLSACTDTSYMFCGSKLSGNLDLRGWNTSNVTLMLGMFYGFTGSTSLNLSNWDVSKVTNFGSTQGSGMFGTSKLTNIDVSNWTLNTTSNATMHSMFYGCSTLTGVTGINTWNTSKITTMIYMFNACTLLPTLDLSNWNLSSCTNFNTMFQASGVKNLNLSNWILPTSSGSSVTMNEMFVSCPSLSAITGLNTWNTSRVTNMYAMFASSPIQTLDLTGWNLSACTTTLSMFQNNTSLKSLNLTGWSNLSNVTVANNMFYNCAGLSAITGTQNWNLSKVTTTLSMFNSCSLLQTLDLSGWNLSNCIQFGTSTANAMFSSSGLKDINVSGWTLSTSTGTSISMGALFAVSSLSAITGLNTWNTSRVSAMNNMFQGSRLTTLDLSTWNVSNVTDMTSMFATCNLLTTVTGMNNWNPSKVTSVSSMFNGCSLLTSLNLNNLNLSACTTTAIMFNGCSSLTGLTVSNWNLNTTSNIAMNTMFQGMGTKTITGLDTWNITKVNNFTSFLASTTLDTTTYSNMLIAWDALDPVNSLAFNGGSSKYNAAGQVARASLVTNDLWSITDGGLA